VAAATAPPAPLAQASSAQGAPPYGVVLFAKDVMVPMRDGVRLATDLYRPALGGVPVDRRFPVLLQRTPYDKASAALVARAEYFARHGYVVALQDIRGRYRSEGRFVKYDARSAADGYDTVQWLAALPYADGRVGMWGTSYGAHTQADAAKLAPPALKALLLNFGGLSNGWKVKVRNHGAFELAQQMGWAWQEAGATDPRVRAALEAEPLERWFFAAPLRRGLSPLSLAPEFEAYLLEEMRHGDYDEYWKSPGVNWSEYYAATADIPMLHVGGWYDTYCASTIENYVALSGLKRSPIRLVMGPWVHGGNARPYAGDVAFGSDAAMPDFDTTVHLAWFDHHLKGRPTGVETWPPIRLFVMGTGDGHRDEAGRLFHGGPAGCSTGACGGRPSVGRFPEPCSSATTSTPTAGSTQPCPRPTSNRRGTGTTRTIPSRRSAVRSRAPSDRAATTSGSGSSRAPAAVRKTGSSGRSRRICP